MQLNQQWNTAQKICFRFVFIFFLLYVVLFNNGAYPFVYFLFTYLYKLLHSFIPWIGEQLLHLPYKITVFTNGSGDTTYDYVCLLLITTVAFFGCIIWSAVDFKRKNYTVLYYWVTVAVRYYVGFTLINYGIVKVIQLQFAQPSFARLTQTYGDSSPMGLAWTFLGFSKTYNIFMGIAELAGALLLFRRTVTIGAVICLMASANVMAVNYCYDVPVKIVSTALVMMCLFLLSPNFKALLQFFFTKQVVQNHVITRPVAKIKWVRYSFYGVKTLTIFFVLASAISNLNYGVKNYGEQAPKSPLYGVYEIERFLPVKKPVQKDTVRWKKLIFDGKEYASVRFENDSLEWYKVRIKIQKNELELTSADSTKRFTGTYRKLKNEGLQVTGTLNRDSMSFISSRKDKKDFRLTGRGFHWINEYPYNR